MNRKEQYIEYIKNECKKGKNETELLENKMDSVMRCIEILDEEKLIEILTLVVKANVLLYEAWAMGLREDN